MITDPNKKIFLRIKNKNIPIWTYGDPLKPPIIFIHGLLRGFSDYIGDLPIRHLMKKYYIAAFDLPGFGYSKNLKIDNSEFINRIQTTVLENRKSTLFGVSYGGLVSLKQHLKFPKFSNKLIIAGTPIFYNIFNIIKLIKYFPKYKGIKIKKVYLDEFNFLNKNNLQKIKIPTLLYYNSSDYIANIFMGKKLQGMIPESKLFISNGQNHQWLLHRIDRNGFLKEINNFLD